MVRIILLGFICFLAMLGAANAGSLTLQRTISAPNVAGRIDHLAFDADDGLLFVAEHDNNSLDAFDAVAGKAVGHLSGLSGPQGVAYLPETRQIAVANGGDGIVRFFDAETLAPEGTVELGSDADNLRVMSDGKLLVAGYGDGGLAFIDPHAHQVTRTISLGAHPEGFQITPDSAAAYVNLPDAGKIGVVDLKSGKVTGFATADAAGNFPIALVGSTGQFAAAFRSPGRLALADAKTSSFLSSTDICGDADDVFYDAKRAQFYVVCGSGSVAVVDVENGQLKVVDNAPTRRGARTGLFVEALDLLFVAAPAAGGESAQILVLKPSTAPASNDVGAGDPESALQKSTVDPGLGKTARETLDQVNAFWTRYFSEHSTDGGSLTYTPPKIVAFSDVAQSGCGIVQSASATFYCPRDETVYLDPNTAAGVNGDGAEAYVIAHEMSHHAQNLFGILPTYSKRRQTMQPEQVTAYTMQVELQADCFTGMSAAGQNWASASTLRDAIERSMDTGTSKINLAPWTTSLVTTDERLQWFNTGLSADEIAQCDTGLPKPWAYFQP